MFWLVLPFNATSAKTSLPRKPSRVHSLRVQGVTALGHSIPVSSRRDITRIIRVKLKIVELCRDAVKVRLNTPVVAYR